MHFSTRRHRGGRAVAGRIPALRMSTLRKQFGDTVVVDDFTLEVPRGCVFELIGPSGAGKSTVAYMAAGLLPPDAGSVDIFGLDVWEAPDCANMLVGLLPDESSAPSGVTGRAWLVHKGLSHGLGVVATFRRAEELLEACGLKGARNRQVGEYTPSMFKRLCLAAALMHRPELLIADEPFEGVDQASAILIGAVLRDFVGAGGTVLLTGLAARLSGDFPHHTRTIGDVSGELRLPATRRRVEGDSPIPSPRHPAFLSAAC